MRRLVEGGAGCCADGGVSENEEVDREGLVVVAGLQGEVVGLKRQRVTKKWAARQLTLSPAGH